MTRLLTRLALIAAATAGLLPAAGQAAPEPARGWSAGVVTDFQEVRSPSPAASPARVGEYVIAPVDEANPLNPGGEGLGPYDLVIPDRVRSGGDYSSVWEVILVLPGEGAPAGAVAWRSVELSGDQVPLAYAADLGHGLEPLTSIAVLQQAAAAGLVDLVDAGFAEICHISSAR